ncbi:carbamoyltransferase N-terminal domain-containing protein, partial [Xanthomonas citri pv. citri]
MTAILGLNLNHPDASAALILDGKVVAAAAEERFGQRIKHDPSFPQHAIQAVLASGGITAKDLDFIAVARDPSRTRAAQVSNVLRNPTAGGMAAMEHIRRARVDHSISDLVAEATGAAPDT